MDKPVGGDQRSQENYVEELIFKTSKAIKTQKLERNLEEPF